MVASSIAFQIEQLHSRPDRNCGSPTIRAERGSCVLLGAGCRLPGATYTHTWLRPKDCLIRHCLAVRPHPRHPSKRLTGVKAAKVITSANGDWRSMPSARPCCCYTECMACMQVCNLNLGMCQEGTRASLSQAPTALAGLSHTVVPRHSNKVTLVKANGTSMIR